MYILFSIRQIEDHGDVVFFVAMGSEKEYTKIDYGLAPGELIDEPINFENKFFTEIFVKYLNYEDGWVASLEVLFLLGVKHSILGGKNDLSISRILKGVEGFHNPLRPFEKILETSLQDERSMLVSWVFESGKKAGIKVKKILGTKVNEKKRA
jgi:hypothetical protein